ncbi:hypothetical protein C8Q77DRAFT_1035356, partial [Trametes polyzona]
SMVWLCPGCNHQFATEGFYNEHLTRGTREICQKAREEYARKKTSGYNNLRLRRKQAGQARSAHSRSASPRASGSAPEDAPPPRPMDPDVEHSQAVASVFDGDFYGNNYDAADFPGFDSDGVLEVSEAIRRAPEVQEGSDDEDDDALHNAADAAVNTTRSEQGGMYFRTYIHSMYPDPDGDVDEYMADPNEGAMDPDRHNDTAPTSSGNLDTEALAELRSTSTYIQDFGGLAGAPIGPSTASLAGHQDYGGKVADSPRNPFAPFQSETDWKIAQWAKMHSISSNTFTELLAIQGVVHNLGLSYKNAPELNKIIDNELPNSRPRFERMEATVVGETFELYARPIMECLVSLYGNPEHARYLYFAPQ